MGKQRQNRSKRTLTNTGVVSTAVHRPAEPASQSPRITRKVQANSGAAFVRRLGLKTSSPAKAPRLSLFGWNIGMRPVLTTGAVPFMPHLVEIAPLETFQALANVYFDKVDPCYGFIDKAQFMERLNARWQLNFPELPSAYDAVISGVAALGCLFSQRNATVMETQLVQVARSILDSSDPCVPPSAEVLTGWTLRTVYLRLTDMPYATWMASCTLMHLNEAAGIHSSSRSILPLSASCSPDIAARLLGVASHLNTWASYDLGLSRVRFQDHSKDILVSNEQGDLMGHLLALLPSSVTLDPSSTEDDVDMTAQLAQVLEKKNDKPVLIMAQSNVALCMLRRIYSQNLVISNELTAVVLGQLRLAFSAARTMVEDCAPWHHVINVPFQSLCILLTLDTSQSLDLAPEAMHTIKLVESAWDTDITREAYATATWLVTLYRQRRNDDLQIFDRALSSPYHDASEGSSQQGAPTAEESSWLNALVADMPGLQDIDLDAFWADDGMSQGLLLGNPTL